MGTDDAKPWNQVDFLAQAVARSILAATKLHGMSLNRFMNRVVLELGEDVCTDSEHQRGSPDYAPNAGRFDWEDLD